jgi:hypothetical protein
MSTTVFEYVFNGTLTAPPSSGQLRMDTTDPTTVTRLWIHNQTATGVDSSRYQLLAKAGDVIDVQDKDDATRYANFDLSAPPVAQTGYVEYTVTFRGGAGTLPAGQRVAVGLVYQ